MLSYLVVTLGFLVTATNGFILGCVNNPCEQICENVLISVMGYRCRCRTGFIVDPSNQNRCLPLKPSCGRGFTNSEYPPYNCVDINECASANSPCEQNCRNSDGSYECFCRSGFVISSNDPNRCQLESVASCDKGFQPNPRSPSTCIDIDECASNSPCQQNCVNSKGSYECRCRSGYQINERDPTRCDIINNCQKGYKPNPVTTECEDIDECSLSTPCEHKCQNTLGGYRCLCNKGYEVSAVNSDRCDDVDECKNNPCEQVCTNTVGGYVCSCRSGFTISASNSAKCESVDRCSNNPCEQVCTSTSSGFQCSCKKGYTVSSSDKTKCVDVNECNDNPCEHSCTNTNGGYKCSCRDGFSVDPDNKNKCIGTDACSVGRRCEHICTIIPKGRKCSCRPGYVVNDEDNSLCDEIEVCKVLADVLLVFDASASMGAENYAKQFQFAKKLVSNFNIGPNDVRFGGVVFSRFTEVIFNLKDHNTIESLHKALSNVEYMELSTYTHLALETIYKQQLFSSTKGGRDNAPDVVILFTDGDPTYTDKAIESAKILKDSGVFIIGVGIGSDLDMSVVKAISSTPKDALEASDYDTLEYIEKRLTQQLCAVKN